MENIASQAIEAKDLVGDSLQSAVRIDEGQIRSHLDQLIRSTVCPAPLSLVPPDSRIFPQMEDGVSDEKAIW